MSPNTSYFHNRDLILTKTSALVEAEVYYISRSLVVIAAALSDNRARSSDWPHCVISYVTILLLDRHGLS